MDLEQAAGNVVEAAAVGASDGMKLALNVAAMLVAIVALVAMADALVGLVPIGFCGDGVVAGWTCTGGAAAEPLSMSILLGWAFSPIAFLIGVPWQDAFAVGRLLGEKIVLTEFIAYVHLGELVDAPAPVLTERGAVIASYALCGFANFASIGIQLGGIGGLAPERMGDLSALGLRAMIAGTIATCMAGAVVGLYL
jgi:CNT family concentrative nucleoside transporter